MASASVDPAPERRAAPPALEDRAASRDRLGALLVALCAIMPATLAASGAANVADAAHDEGVVRALGWGWTGAWRALDVPVAALAQVLPIGTRAFRASLAGAAITSTTSAIAFGLARPLLARAGSTPRLGAVLACVAAAGATVGAPWQIEARAPGGSVLGALLALLPLALFMQHARIELVALTLGAALGYEPLAGLAGLTACGALVALDRGRRPPLSRALGIRAAAGFALGLAPLGLALLSRRQSTLSLAVSPFVHALGERGESGRTRPWIFAREELGWIAILLIAGGVAAIVLAPKARALGAALFSYLAVGALAMVLGAPAGPTRYASPVLAAWVAAFVFVSVGMERIARAVAQAPIPFARASAAMIVVLGLALPVRLADDAIARGDERGRGLAALWDEIAWGPAPPAAVVLVQDRRSLRRLVASRAAGALRPDLAIVPVFDLSGRMASRELLREPKLGPFWRDLSLGVPPEEFSFSSLAQARPLMMPYDVKWDRALARHLVPVGLVSRYEPEPRGQSDRRKALDSFTPDRDRLAKAMTPRDPELTAATAWLLRARLLALASTGDKDVVARGLDDLRPFSPNDPLAAQVVRRTVISKGVIEVRDLSP